VSDLKSSFVLGILLVLTIPSLAFMPCSSVAAISQSQAVSALDDAEGVVVFAYQAVLRAGESGANVSGLLVRLNDAGQLLTRARMAFGSGDFDSALELAVLCQERLSGFVADADALAEAAIRDRNLDFLVNMVGSFFGSVAVVCGGLVAWFYLDRKYGKLGVRSNESS